MIIFECVIFNPYYSTVTLTKFQGSADISQEKLEDKFDYTRIFLWHPDFVYLNLFGESREGKFRIGTQDEISTFLEDAEWSFAFPLKLRDGDQLFITDHENYYPLEIDAGIYYVVVETRQLTHGEIKNDTDLMQVYEKVGHMPLDVEIPYLYHVNFCRSDRFQPPQILRMSDRYWKIKALRQESSRRDHIEAVEYCEKYFEKVHVLDTNYQPALLEESGYEFS